MARGGTLSAGNTYFYRHTKGPTRTVGEDENDWWSSTDDDGNAGVWVNTVYVGGGDNFQPITGVPRS